ncbi:hypothetical protein SprV_0702450800 [Sparganum proliferum]
MGRAAVVNVAQLVSYSQFKQMILEHKLMTDGVGVYLVASMCSALITTIASLPVDIAKTRIQNMRTINGMPEYSGMFDVFSRVIRQEGMTALWKDEVQPRAVYSPNGSPEDVSRRLSFDPQMEEPSPDASCLPLSVTLRAHISLVFIPDIALS